MTADGNIHDFNHAGGMPLENLANYVAGAKDTRKWGTWEALSVKVVDGVVVECEKRIVVNPTPMGILSLQMHEGRGEVWTVEEGVLTVILNGQKHNVSKGQSIIIPQGAIHCMINETNSPVSVHEIQRGICQEKDNHRLEDAHGRKDSVNDDEHVATMIKTLKSRFDAQDFAPDDDYDLINIYLTHRNEPAELKDSLLNVLNVSRHLYAPHSVLVQSYQPAQKLG